MPSSNSRIVLLLDESGSMSSQKNDVIGGINETIKSQRSIKTLNPKSTILNIVTFNSYITRNKEYTLDVAPTVTENDYSPSGSTALFDAMGTIMQKYMHENDVIMVIATDGEENASKSFNYKQITGLVDQLKTNKNWNFIYLSEDIDTFRQAQSLGIDSRAENCNNICVQKNSLGKAICDFKTQSAISQMRQGDRNVKYSL